MTNQERLQQNNAKIEAIQQTLANKVVTSGEIELTENGKHDVSKYASANVNVQPNLVTKAITQNGTYNASDDGADGYSSVDVNVPTPDLSETTATAEDVLEGKEFYNASGEKVAGTYKDMLQARVDKTNSCAYLFYGYSGSLDFSASLDTSNATSGISMYEKCTTSSFPIIDTKNFKSMEKMYFGCDNIVKAPAINTGSATSMVNMFSTSLTAGTKLEEIPAYDTRKVTLMTNMCSKCAKLVTVNLLDMISVTGAANIFNGCKSLTNLTLKNIKISLQIGYGEEGYSNTYGYLLTLDSLLNTIQELWTNTGTSTRTLTMGTANTAKLADVYVKLIDITDEMRAEDEYIDNKAPFEVCESTDEGAMLITEYVTTVKNWQLA